MKGILLSLVILIPTILPRQTPLVPFPGIFSTYIGAHLSKRQFCLRPLSREPFFNLMPISRQRRETQRRFRPLSWGPFFNMRQNERLLFHGKVFVPFIGDFFQSIGMTYQIGVIELPFSSPLSGTFFNPALYSGLFLPFMFSSPLSGTFFNRLW